MDKDPREIWDHYLGGAVIMIDNKFRTRNTDFHPRFVIARNSASYIDEKTLVLLLECIQVIKSVNSSGSWKYIERGVMVISIGKRNILFRIEDYMRCDIAARRYILLPKDVTNIVLEYTGVWYGVASYMK